MRRLKISLTVVFFFALASSYLLEAQEPRDWKNGFDRVVLKSGVLDAGRTFEEMEDGVPTKVYVRVDSGLKYLPFSKISSSDQFYVCQELCLPTDADEDSTPPADESDSPSSVDSQDWTGDFEAGARKTLTVDGVEFAFRYCPAGSYTMGSPSSEERRFDDEDQRSVTISEGFWICETETTQEQWDAVGVKKEMECEFKGAKLPVETVTWNESDAFIKKLNELGVAPKGWRFVLPTEEQWEYACRAGTTGSTYGFPLDEAAWYGEYGVTESTHEVGTKKSNKWGIFDMLGNVWEWTCSKYEGGSSFVNRGGSWFDIAQFCRPAVRLYGAPTYRDNNLGFRSSLVRR